MLFQQSFASFLIQYKHLQYFLDSRVVSAFHTQAQSLSQTTRRVEKQQTREYISINDLDLSGLSLELLIITALLFSGCIGVSPRSSGSCGAVVPLGDMKLSLGDLKQSLLAALFAMLIRLQAWGRPPHAPAGTTSLATATKTH